MQPTIRRGIRDEAVFRFARRHEAKSQGCRGGRAHIREVLDGSSTCLACGGPLSAAPVIVGRDFLHGIGGTYPVHQCRRCESGTTLPLASAEEIAFFYPDEYVPHEVPKGPLSRVMQIVQRIRNRRQPLRRLRGRAGSLLDVGCGRGDLGASLIADGWRVTGIEPDAGACRVAGARGIAAHQGTLQTVTLPANEFDAVIFQHCLEHVPAPPADLRVALRALRPGGTLIITVPNWASWQRRLFGERWFPMELPRHRTHFTAQGLELALAEAEFTDIETFTSTPFICLCWTLQYWLFDRLLTDRGLKLWVGYLASVPLCALAAIGDRLLGQGDFLHAVARRPSD